MKELLLKKSMANICQQKRYFTNSYCRQGIPVFVEVDRDIPKEEYMVDAQLYYHRLDKDIRDIALCQSEYRKALNSGFPQWQFWDVSLRSSFNKTCENLGIPDIPNNSQRKFTLLEAMKKVGGSYFEQAFSNRYDEAHIQKLQNNTSDIKLINETFSEVKTAYAQANSAITLRDKQILWNIHENKLFKLEQICKSLKDKRIGYEGEVIAGNYPNIFNNHSALEYHDHFLFDYYDLCCIPAIVLSSLILAKKFYGFDSYKSLILFIFPLRKKWL